MAVAELGIESTGGTQTKVHTLLGDLFSLDGKTAVVVGGGVRYEGRKLLPDVDERCEEVAGWITPRVGGVGPTTIAMLFRNAVESAERRAGVVRSAR